MPWVRVSRQNGSCPSLTPREVPGQTQWAQGSKKTGHSRSARRHRLGQRETKAFAARNNRLSIIEGGELKHLLAEHLNLDVRIDLVRHPRRPT